jgi:hypothetical protein
VPTGARPQLGAVDVPGWLGAVSPDRTPPRGPERGPRGGGSDLLELDLDLAGVLRRITADFPSPVPRGHALGEQLRDTYADTAG